MRCAWATPPRRMLRGLRAYQKVNVQASELTCDLSGEDSAHPPEIRDYRAHMREETLPARSFQQHVRKKLAQHAIKSLFSAIFRSLGELFRAHARIKASQGEFAHRTQRHGTTETAITSAHPQHGTAETADTSAPKNRAKNAHFSPAKAMAVSNHRASSPAAPTRSARGRRRNPISTHSHAIPPRTLPASTHNR